MVKHFSIILISFLAISTFCQKAKAQTRDSLRVVADSLMIKAKPRATIFIPLYLDSAFPAGKYKHGNSIPNHIINGLDFFNGVKIAADELNAEGIATRIQILDSKSANSLDQLFRDTTFEDMGIVISAAQSASEFKSIAERLRPTGTPLISLLPNDAGVSNYPQLLLANSTLKVHCEQLYKFVQRNHSIDNIVMLNSAGVAENRLKQYLQEENANTKSVPLKWQEVDFSESLNTETLVTLLDSNQLNIIIAPTLNGVQAQRIVKMLSSLSSTYRSAVFGMPTWETVAFTKPEFKNVDVWYGTPFVTSSGNAYLTEQFTKKFNDLTNSRPGDMAYRGYEITLRYIKTMVAFGPDFMKHINDYQFKMFNDFNFQPVSVRNTDQVDYHENQKIYFIKKTDGAIKTIMAP
jgi:hypothetical protein